MKFVEQYIEWVAVALGGLFLVAMLYLYVLTPPVTTLVGTQQLTPGQVPEAVRQGKVTDLRKMLGKEPSVPAVAPKPIEANNYAARPLPQNYFTVSRGTDVIVVNPQPNQPNVPVAPSAKITAPVLPAPTFAAFSKVYRGLVIIPGPNNAVAPPVARDGVVSAAFDLSAPELAQAWAKASFPRDQSSTFVLRVVVERQELKNGTWGPAEIVKPLQHVPAELLAYPAATAKLEDQHHFRDLASRNQTWIIAPPFYQVSGAPWVAPGEAVVVPKAPPVVKPPAPAPNTPPKPSGRRGGAGFGLGPIAPVSPSGAFNAQSQEGPPGPVRPGGPSDGPAGPFVPAPAGAGMGMGAFNPADLKAPIRFLIHDEAVKPAATYRYRIRYELANPVFSLRITPKEIDSVLGFESKWSDWSPSITILETVQYFVTAVSTTGRQPVRVRVFEWRDGKSQPPVEVTLGPGDLVPGTDVTLIDMQAVIGNESVVFATADGGIVPRRVAADRVAADILRAEQAAEQPVDPAQPPGGSPDDGGRPAGPPGPAGAGPAPTPFTPPGQRPGGRPPSPNDP